MIVAHNFSAMNAFNNLKENRQNSEKLMEKLSSGKQVNRAADDAAGLAISSKMLGQIRGLDQASRNSNDGISLVLTAQGGLSEINNALQRIRELCVRSANDSMVDDDRLKTQEEIDSLLLGINQTARMTKFNGIPLLAVEDEPQRTSVFNNGLAVLLDANTVNAAGQMDLQTISGGRLNYRGGGLTDNLSVIINGINYNSLINNPNVTRQKVSDTEFTFTITDAANNIDVVITQTLSVTGPDSNIYKIDYSIENNNPTNDINISFMLNIDTMLGNDDRAPCYVDGVDINKIPKNYTGTATPDTVVFYNQNNHDFQGSFIFSGFDITKSPSTINIGNYSSVYDWNWTPPGTTFGDSAISIRWENVVVKANKSFDTHFYYGSTIPGQAPVDQGVKLADFKSGLIIHTGANTDQNILLTRHDVTTPNLGIDTLKVSTASEANDSIALADKALEKIAGELGRYGSYQNRLEYAGANADVSSENTTAARSRVIDTNVAKKFSDFGKYSVLEQSSISMLAQANQIPQRVLELLR